MVGQVMTGVVQSPHYHGRLEVEALLHISQSAGIEFFFYIIAVDTVEKNLELHYK